MGIFLGGTFQGAVHQVEGGYEIPAGARGRGGTAALRCREPPVHPNRRAVRPAKELLQPVVAELPRKVPQPEHVLEELVHRGHPPRVVASNCEELGLCCLGMQVQIRTNSLEFKFAPNSQEFVDRSELEFATSNSNPP